MGSFRRNAITSPCSWCNQPRSAAANHTNGITGEFYVRDVDPVLGQAWTLGYAAVRSFSLRETI